MYKKVRRTDVIRLTPERLGDDYETICRNLTRETLEGKASPDKSLTILVSNIENVGEGRSESNHQHQSFHRLLRRYLGQAQLHRGIIPVEY
jgi:DNA-directed RNA polymerase subunit E'/Rpb7